MTLSAAILAAFDACVVTLEPDLFIRFSKIARPTATIAYSLIEDPALGALSFAFESMYPGIVVATAATTLVVIGVALAAFMTDFVRNSSTLARIAGIGYTAFFSYHMAGFVFSIAGLVDMTAVNNARILGIPLGIIIGIFTISVGVLYFIRGFNTVKVDVANNVPERYS